MFSMKLSWCSCMLLALATLSEAAPSAKPSVHKPLVQSNQLRRRLLRSELLKKGQHLQDIAYATEARNRVIGSVGHNNTVKYLYDTLTALNYYDVSLQSFTVPQATAALSINSKVYETSPFTFTVAGTPTAPLVVVPNLGCDAADFAGTAVAGKIALISRGTCTFAIKTLNAKAAGAIGALVYQTKGVEGVVQGTLGEADDYIPTAGLSYADGQALVASITGGTVQTAALDIDLFTVTTQNVIAQTKKGDKKNVLMVGAHSDSVEAGPGINDNGSGSIGILEVATQLAKFGVNNAVRFAWWSAEEAGLVGSEYYVTNLPQEEKDKIRLYLNFDMIASPNFVYGIYDGDGSAFNVSGPAGSGNIEKLFEDYFKNDAGLQTVPSEFDGRSDYGPFLDAGIAAGGLDAGADGTKTEEEVAMFGGTAGLTYDPNYHSAKDTLANCNVGAWIQISKGIAHAVATYARSWKGFPTKIKGPPAKRDVVSPYEFQAKGGKWIS